MKSSVVEILRLGCDFLFHVIWKLQIYQQKGRKFIQTYQNSVEKWQDGGKMGPKIGQGDPWSPNIATKGLTKHKACDEEAGR